MAATSAPLADYFWIAGVDSISYSDSGLYGPQSRDRSPDGRNRESIYVDETIHEDSEASNDFGYSSPILGSTPARSGRHVRSDSGSKMARPPLAMRLSMQSIDSGEKSNRSSATFRAGNGEQTNATGKENLDPLDDIHWQNALAKFANERDSFLEDLSFSAGTVLHSRPPMTARTEKIVDNGDGNRHNQSPFKKANGTLRRKISMRDMSSAQRRPPPRTPSVRTSKRMSNYNSVIPPPEPINTDPTMHPLKRRFEPVLLDRYPPKSAVDEAKRRGRFPDYVPMFAFPHDINIVSSDDRPRSTWHGFAMTGDDNAKIYGVTVIVWMPLGQETADEVERRCEAWRQAHMTNEERELAANLGERLASERATLSQLLAQLPTVTSGSPAREALEDRISAVEEKITLMTDMLRPVRHGAAAKIDGLTNGETGLWTPRAYGVLGRDASMTSFWKEWLRAVVIPMTDGAILRVPLSSPQIGRWQPLERYVVNLCTEALSPITSKTQVELSVRELRLFARKEALNELPESRNTDLYALFRSLSIHNVVALFEFALSESRIILLSSHTAMLHLASKALVSLLYPLQWQSVFIPVLPARLISALEAPCPYIVGVERQYENVELPEDDYVLVDLDNDSIEATSPPVALPRQQRRKLFSLLQLSALHHNRCGVPIGPPPYAIESFPYDAFSSELPSIFTQNASHSTLSKYVSENSISYGDRDDSRIPRTSVFNAFLQSKDDHTRIERPSTSKSRQDSPPGSLSPSNSNFPSMMPPAVTTPTTPVSRNDSGFALTATLREKRSGHFDAMSRRSSSFGVDRAQTLRRPGPAIQGHQTSLSTSSLAVDTRMGSGYAPSTYAASTIAASTIMPAMLLQPVQNTNNMIWVEGHCMHWHKQDRASVCSICDENAEHDGMYKCAECSVVAHGRCLGQCSLVCPAAFYADRIRAAFVRCFASLFYTYRKFLKPPNRQQKQCGHLYSFDMDGFTRTQPIEQADYITMLKQTQAFNEFLSIRETTPASSPKVRLFDEIILAKKNRGFSRASFFAKAMTNFLDDKSDHLWRSAAVPSPSGAFQGDYRSIICRIPAKLDLTLMKEPRILLGVPRADQGKQGVKRRKAVPSMIGTEDNPSI